MANAISYTGVYSFPYPLGSDDISSGAARLQALAERMEAVLVDAGIEIGTYDVLKTSTVFAGDITGLYNALQIGANTITSVELADNSVDSAAIVAGAVTSAKLGVVDLPNGSTATTQSQLDGSTNVATTSYVDLAAYNIVIGTLPPDSIVNSMVNSAAAISYSKLNLTGSIVNADINASAAIDKTKISGTAVTVADTGTVTSTMILDGTILNADVNASAGIAYSKLNLATSIVNADVSASAAIAYSKLALTGAILNADLAGSIDPTKVTGTAVVTADSRLTDARTPTGAAGGILSGTYPNPGFAVDMATQSELDTHASDTTSVHGIADTSVLATATDVSTAVSTHSSDTTSVHGIADTSVLATATDVSTAVSTHSSDTTSVHGITDTANLVLTSDSRLTDARTPTAHAGTHVPGGSDVLDYTKIVGYGTALPTWSATTHPAGVLWVVNTVGEPYSLYRSDGVSAWKQVGGGGASVTASDTAPSSPTSGALWFDSTTGKTFIWYVDGSSNQWVEVGEASQLSIPSHGSSHVRGGSDIIDGDRVTVDYVPTNYTRNSAATGAGDVTDLTAHLAGIDMILPAGMLMPYAGSTEPTGWVFCYGQTVNSVSNTAYARLWTAIGTTYGGASASSFILPDLRGRAVFGKDNMGGTAASRVTSGVSAITGTTLGASGGQEQLASHQHEQSFPLHTSNAGSNGVTPYLPWNTNLYGYGTTKTYANRQGFTVAGAEGNSASGYPPLTNTPFATATNMPPTIITNYLIKL